MEFEKKFDILIVDDDKVFRESLKYILEEKGYTIITAADGEEALEILKKLDIELVLTDIHMPKVNGIQLVRELNKLNFEKKVIMMSAFIDMERIPVEIKNSVLFIIPDKDTLKIRSAINCAFKLTVRGIMKDDKGL